jgi:hypothetical protein
MTPARPTKCKLAKRMYTSRRMRLGLGKPGPDFLCAAKRFFDDFRLHLDEIGVSILNRVKNLICGNSHPRGFATVHIEYLPRHPWPISWRKNGSVIAGRECIPITAPPKYVEPSLLVSNLSPLGHIRSADRRRASSGMRALKREPGN